MRRPTLSKNNTLAGELKKIRRTLTSSLRVLIAAAQKSELDSSNGDNAVKVLEIQTLWAAIHYLIEFPGAVHFRKPLDQFEFSATLRWSLQSADVQTVQDLATKPTHELRKRKRFGIKSEREARKFLGKMGLRLNMPQAPLNLESLIKAVAAKPTTTSEPSVRE